MRIFIPTLVLLPIIALAQSSSSSSAAASASAGAPGAYLQAVLTALTAANLTSLVTVAETIANTTEGMTLLGGLASGNKTVFAPSNAAFANVSANVASNATMLTQILSYHILNTTYTAAGIQTAPNHTIARTLLKGSGYSLPGNFSAPLVLSTNTTNATSFMINQATDNVSAAGPAMAANLYVYIVEEVLSLPPNITAAATALLPSLAGVIQQAGLLDALSNSPGITVFAPNDAAINAVAASLGSNTTVIADVLANHVINGSVVYSTGLASGTHVSAGGQAFSFITNSSGAYVSSANATAKIVQSDIIISNGVVHVIDGVLLNTANDEAAAVSAYSSGTAAAATSVEATGPVTATSAMGSAGSTSGSSQASKAAAGSFAAVGIANSIFGLTISIGGALLGGAWLLI
ncbi:hypothetical protein P7C73_g1503, partial [Tremellales sp. Uapishka_1]